MQKKTLITWSIFFLFSFFTPIALSQTVYYCSGCVRNGLCPVSKSFSTCAEAEASGRLSCPGGGWSVDCNKSEGGSMTSMKRFNSPLGNGIMGSLLGGLVGSLMEDANGNNQWATGAAGGYFFFSSLTYITTPKSRPLGVNILLGGMTGAAGAFAGVKIVELSKNQTTPAIKDNTAVITAAGAGVGALIGITFPRKNTKGGYNSLIRKSNIFSKTAFTTSGNKASIIVKL